MTSEATTPPATTPLSRRERAALTVHRELDHRLSAVGVWAMRRTRGSLARPWGVNALLLTTTGRRTGRSRTVVLQYFPDGRDMIVAAANDGGSADPAWYRNLQDHPSAIAEVSGARTAVTASELPQDEAAAWWSRILETAPDYERYARATARRIPVVRLTPAPAGAGQAHAGTGQAPAGTGSGASGGRRPSALVVVLVAAACAGAVGAWWYERRRAG